ncbi:hypothetical protein BDW22DRAFT_1389779 [Trametopsis cervina]|nr:hypothetical protein BDW22DRAFT_1389779 [Trametopsis cervina]
MSSTISGFPIVPEDVVQRVLEELFYDDQHQPDYAALSACSQVCTLWRPLAQKLLFHQVKIPGRSRGRHLASFCTAVYSCSPQSETLASYVRRVVIVLGNPAINPHSNDVSDLIELLSHCHGIYEMSLHVSGVELDANTMEALRDAHRRSFPTPVRALNLSCGILSPILYHLLSVWPTVQFLRLGVELVAPIPKGPSPVQLYELALHRLPQPHIMQWLLSSSEGSLRILEFPTATTEQYDHVLEKHYEHLHSLRFFRQTLRSSTLVRRFTNLRELLISQLSSFLPLGDLPQSIEHLGFRHFSGVAANDIGALDTLVSAIDKLPRLRLISCDASAKGNHAFATLENSCKQRGVVISFDVQSWRTYEDPVPLCAYPRGRSIHNLPYMNQPTC